MNAPTYSPSAILSAGAIGVFSIFATHAALAVDLAPENAKPPVKLEDRVEAPEVIVAKLPFIGVVTASLPEKVAEQLNLEHGVGVIVDSVTPKSPADLAGIKPNDIILKINANDVNDPEAFRAQIRSHKIGDKIKLKVIQKSKPADLEVTLVERPADAIAEIQNQEPLLDRKQNVQTFEINIGGVIDGGLGRALGEGEIEEKVDPNLLADKNFNMVPKQMDDGVVRGAGIIPIEGVKNLQFDAHTRVRIEDEQGAIEKITIGENTDVTVMDAANRIVWSGRWDTEQDKAAAPEDIRARIDKLPFVNPGGLKIEPQE